MAGPNGQTGRWVVKSNMPCHMELHHSLSLEGLVNFWTWFLCYDFKAPSIVSVYHVDPSRRCSFWVYSRSAVIFSLKMEPKAACKTESPETSDLPTSVSQVMKLPA